MEKRPVENQKKIDRDIADLDDEYAKKSFLGKFFGKKRYESAKKELEQSKSAIENQSSYNNKLIARELAISYDESGGTGSHHGEKYDDSQNEEWNRRFFGLDNPERAKKIERAIELRKQYESEWNKKN